MPSPPHWQELRLSVRALPELPGVYFWKDNNGKILYIGKAVNLRARVSSYFHRAAHDRRTRDLLMRARVVDHEVAATELDALFRESLLIKQHQPTFNRALRRPRTMFYLKLDRAIPDPYPEVTRGMEEDGSLYFGPFRTGAIARETLRFIHDVLPLRKCTRIKPKCRPCMYFQMRTCAAPALDDLHREKHEQAIHQLHELLEGRSDRVLHWLEAKRDRLSNALLFERAAEMQDRVEILQDMVRRQVILDAAVQCRYVLILTNTSRDGGPRLLLVAHGKVLSVRDGNDADLEAVCRWIRAHESVMRIARDQTLEEDAASVLERWLVSNSSQVRWVAIPHDYENSDLEERVAYVLQRVPVAV